MSIFFEAERNTAMIEGTEQRIYLLTRSRHRSLQYRTSLLYTAGIGIKPEDVEGKMFAKCKYSGFELVSKVYEVANMLANESLKILAVEILWKLLEGDGSYDKSEDKWNYEISSKVLKSSIEIYRHGFFIYENPKEVIQKIKAEGLLRAIFKRHASEHGVAESFRSKFAFDIIESMTWTILKDM